MILAPALGPPVGSGAATRDLPGWLQRFPFPGGPRLVVVMTGDADVDTSPQLREQLDVAVANAPGELVVDVSDVAFVDLSGLDDLHEAAQAAREAGVALTVRGLSPLLWWVHRQLLKRELPVG